MEPTTSIVTDNAANQNALPPKTHDSWLSDLYLKIQDKQIIESSLWLNDRIINAAKTLIKQSMDYNINGFEDVITAAIRTPTISLSLFRLFTFRNIGCACQMSCAVQQMLQLFTIVHMP